MAVPAPAEHNDEKQLMEQQVVVSLTSNLLEQIENFRIANRDENGRIRSRSAVLRQIIEKGLRVSAWEANKGIKRAP